MPFWMLGLSFFMPFGC